MVIHAAQAALNAASVRRLGTVQARTSSGIILGPMEAQWAQPWNDADVDMDIAHADMLGGVHLGQKSARTQNALNELVTSWNEQMKTTKVLLYRHSILRKFYAVPSPSPRVSGGLRSRPRETNCIFADSLFCHRSR